MLHQLRGHLLANNLSETFQSAYRAHHSTETALLDVTNCFLGSANEGRVFILTLLGLSAAFDTLDQISLLARLHGMFGIPGKAFELQSVSVNGRNSSQKIHHGVPQGSVLGPNLFSLYTQPLSNTFDLVLHSFCTTIF